jgi:hypothetical protein
MRMFHLNLRVEEMGRRDDVRIVVDARDMLGRQEA